MEYPSYYGHLTAVENLEAIRRITGGPKSRISEVLEIVSLTKEAKRPVKGYSLGMKRSWHRGRPAEQSGVAHSG